MKTERTHLPPADLAVLATHQALGGIAAIAAERQRQVIALGWTHDHDDEHTDSALAAAAAAYAIPASTSTDDMSLVTMRQQLWPWEVTSRSPVSATGPNFEMRLRELEKAGALIAAEHDRLTRAAGFAQHPLEIKAAPAQDHAPGSHAITLRINIPASHGDNLISPIVGAVLAGYMARLCGRDAGSTDAEFFTGEHLAAGPRAAEWLRDVTLTVTASAREDDAAIQLVDLLRLRPYHEWSDDDGPVLWWALRDGKIEEPPFHAGTPHDSDWDASVYESMDYSLYWTPIPEPSPIA